MSRILLGACRSDNEARKLAAYVRVSTLYKAPYMTIETGYQSAIGENDKYNVWLNSKRKIGKATQTALEAVSSAFLIGFRFGQEAERDSVLSA